MEADAGDLPQIPSQIMSSRPAWGVLLGYLKAKKHTKQKASARHLEQITILNGYN